MKRTDWKECEQSGIDASQNSGDQPTQTGTLSTCLPTDKTLISILADFYCLIYALQPTDLTLMTTVLV